MSKIEKVEIELNSEKVNKRERRIKVLKMGLLISALFLMIIYVILRVIYEQGAFTVSLDQNFAKKSGVIIYEDKEAKESRRILEAEKKEFIDNINENKVQVSVYVEGQQVLDAILNKDKVISILEKAREI